MLSGGGIGSGGGLGFTGNGYGVWFDTYWNPGLGDPSSNYVGLIKDSYGNHLVSNTSVPKLNDNLWHNAVIQVNSNTVIVYIDSNLVLQYKGTLDTTYGGFGFSAATGLSSDWHEIDNVSLTYQPETSLHTLTALVENATSPLSSSIIYAGNNSAITNSSGYATFSLIPGIYNITATYPGYQTTSTFADMKNDQAINLNLGTPYLHWNQIPNSNIKINQLSVGYNISLLNPFQLSTSDVFFNWNYAGMLQNGTNWTNFIVPCSSKRYCYGSFKRNRRLPKSILLQSCSNNPELNQWKYWRIYG